MSTQWSLWRRAFKWMHILTLFHIWPLAINEQFWLNSADLFHGSAAFLPLGFCNRKAKAFIQSLLGCRGNWVSLLVCGSLFISVSLSKGLLFFKNILIYLFGYAGSFLRHTGSSVTASKLLAVHTGSEGVFHVAWELLVEVCKFYFPNQRLNPGPPTLGVQSLSHWTTKEIPNGTSLMFHYSSIGTKLYASQWTWLWLLLIDFLCCSKCWAKHSP